MRKFEFFIANKFIRDHYSAQKTRPIIRISIIAVALSCAVMILTSAVVRGFKDEISQKVIGFGAHIQINHYDNKNGYETIGIPINPELETLGEENNVRKIQSFIAKAGILKKGKLFTTNVLKGVGADFDWAFFSRHLLRGQIPKVQTDKTIFISAKTAKELNAEVGDEVLLYFIQDPPRIRKLKISGIYESGFGQFDELISLTGIELLRHLNDWAPDQISGYEVLVSDFSRINETADALYSMIPNNQNATTIMEAYPDIFNWLELQDVNFVIIAILMLLVAAINMISALVILIIERSPAIGSLKALGATNGSIRRIFLLKGSYLLFTGMFWGNLTGLMLAWLQSTFELVKLPVESYYLSAVPIAFHPPDLLLINALAIVICLGLMIIPSYLITRVNLVKVLRFR